MSGRPVGGAGAIGVRHATVADAATISALNADVQGVHAAALPWLFKAPSPDTFPPATAAALLARDDVIVYVAYLGDQPAGYAYAQVRRHPETSLQYAFDEIYLHHLSVRPGRRGHGVGAALLAAIRRAAADRGIRQLALDVWSFNERAQAFFRRHGFETYNQRLWLR
jgi:ribosomal protein S18 acetylase RimI-like enzyme